MQRKLLWTCLFGTVIVITGCGGGGGGGGGGGSPYNSPSPILRPVPYSTPVRVGTVKPMNSTAFESDSSALFSQNLSGNGEELITAGRAGTTQQGTYPTYNLNIFGWNNGTLVNQTSQWFSGTDNVILGTEPSVKFADFDGDGRKDMYVASYSDNAQVGSGWVFFNNGSSFSRTDLNLGVHGHDSAVYDINGDGRSDIFTTGSRVSFAFADRTFTTHTVTGSNYGGTAGSVAIADFMSNGTSSIILTDQNSWGSGNNRLYSWSMVDGGRPTLDFHLSLISTLPDSRFLLPKWSAYGFTGSHDYRALAFDFDSSGRPSAVIFSRPALTNGVWPDFNEIQFLKNQGGGTFVDVTDTVLVGYNTAGPTTYNPKLMDVNSDGLIDIVLGGTKDGTGAQVLIHTKEHKYVASYGTVINAFVAQAGSLEKAINNSAETGGNGIVFVQGPDGAMYLATAITYNSCQGNCSSHQEKAIYLSKVGATTASAQATAAAIKQAWPWMSDGQVNTVLAQSSTQWFGMNLLDSEKALSPLGKLQVPTAGGMMDLSGSVSGIRLGNHGSNIRVLDSLGRDFVMDYRGTSLPSVNAWNRFSENMSQDDTRGTQVANLETRTHRGFKFGSTPDSKTMAIGITDVAMDDNTRLNMQYTRLPFSPFVSLSGSWGQVSSSGTFETTLTHRDRGWVAKLGSMYSVTDIQPGLVTRVNPISSVWTELGHEWSNSRLYAGILPKVIHGSADVSLPTGIDMLGQISYTDIKAKIHSPTVTYIRFHHRQTVDKNTRFNIYATITQQRQHNVMVNVTYQW